MTDDLDRAARALDKALKFECFYKGPPDQQGECADGQCHCVKHYETAVAAVLRELREPSEAMRKTQYSGPCVSWRDTIDAILVEPHDR